MNSLLLLLGLLLAFVSVSSGSPSAQGQIRIVDGVESAQGKWSFFAGIFNKQRQNEPYCGAVVWDKDSVLTSGHCVSNDDGTIAPPELFDVYMGYTSWTEPRDQQYMFKVREIIIHPKYGAGQPFNDDIALIFLDRSIDFDDANRKAQCVCDPEPLGLLNTTVCMTMGWGLDAENKRPINIMEVFLPILDDTSCSIFEKENFYPNHQLCAGYADPLAQPGICLGDSGGPLVCPHLADPSKYSLVGISAHFSASKQPCGQSPSYFTNVNMRLQWIGSVSPKTSNGQAPH